MTINKEKLIIYQFMREILEERRNLTKQYFELKEKLDQFEEIKECASKQMETTLTIMDKEKIQQQDYFFQRNKTQYHNSFDRVSRTILSILKQAQVPLSNKEILNKLTKEYELSISLNNLTCNILPKMNNECSLPIQRASRGYWQYELSSNEGSKAVD